MIRPAVQDTLLVEGLTQQEQADSQLELVRDGYERVIIRPLKAGTQRPGELVLLMLYPACLSPPCRAWGCPMSTSSRQACWGLAQHTRSCDVLALRSRQPQAVRPASEHAVLTAASCGQLIAAVAVSSAVLAPDIGCQVANFGWMDGAIWNQSII